jgi:hypothetical protein
MTKPLTQLMQKDMTRQEFLLTLGLATASIFGFSTIIRMLTGHSLDRHARHGYGSSSYGGNRN